jgi:hypothetical protein
MGSTLMIQEREMNSSDDIPQVACGLVLLMIENLQSDTMYDGLRRL